MISLETLTTAKIFISCISIGLIVFKSFTIISYNNTKEDEPISFNLFGLFSSMEIDGSYTSKRRQTLQLCNRLTGFFYLCVFLFIISLLVPVFVEKMSLL